LPPIRAASGFPKILEHALPKIDIRSKTRQIHLKALLAADLAGFERGFKNPERPWFPQPAPKLKNAFIHGPAAGERGVFAER
jgi:hypothetical protein